MTSEDGSWLAVMAFLEAAVGPVMGAITVDRIGRKTCMLIVSPLYFITWLVVAYAPSVMFLNCVRFVAGIGDGIAFTALPIYIGEISDSSITGFLGSLIPVTTFCGFLLINMIRSYLTITTTAVISSVVPLLHFASFYWMSESPYFLIMKKRDEETIDSLKKLKGMINDNGEFDRLRAAVKDGSENSGRLLDLSTVKSNRRAVIMVMEVRAVQPFSGANAITFYSQIIFAQAGSGISIGTATTIYLAVQLLAYIITSVLVDKNGKRPLLILSVIGSGIFLAAEGLYFYFQTQIGLDLSQLSYLSLLVLLLYVITFNLAMGNILVLMLGELFPTSMKAFAMCLAYIYFGAIVTVVSKFFQMIKDDFGMHVPFFAFAACCAIGLIFIVVCVPETKGKTLEEIQQYLKGEYVETQEKSKAEIT